MFETLNPAADDPRVAPATRRGVRFGLGQVTSTIAANVALAESGEHLRDLVARHARGDWGEAPPDERAENLRSARTQRGSILSMYRTRRGLRVWIATDETRERTVAFTPDDIGEVIFFEREERERVALAA